MSQRLSILLGKAPINMHHSIYESSIAHPDNPWINLLFFHSMLSSSSAAFSIPFFIEPLTNALKSETNKNIRCYLVDARNHGLSPHSDTFCLDSMSVDLDEFIIDHQLNDNRTPLILIGHSMGAKVNMLYSLLNGENLNGLISLDASPASYYHDHQRIFEAMKGVDFSKVNRKFDADQQLKQLGIADGSERGYILENLSGGKGNNENGWGWKCNLDVIAQNEHEIHSFPDTEHMSVYHGHTLFLGGNRNSDRLTNPLYLEDLDFWFPNHKISLFDGGHFIHRTHQTEVQHEMVQYIKNCK